MRIAAGKVKDGKVVLEGKPFAKGASVTVIASRDLERLELTPGEEAELLEAVAEIDRGNYVDGDELLRNLKVRR